MKISKRILSVITSAACTFTVCIGAMTFSASADTFGDLEYNVNSDHIEIVGCNSSATNVSVPPKIQSMPVTIIKDDAFKGCSDLSQVILPDTVTQIGNSAFYNCTSLKSINIPEGVTSVGASAFYGTAMFGSGDDKAKYVDGWVVDCDSTTAVNIKSGTVGIADSAFSNCGLETVTIPETVKVIGHYAFNSNNALRTVTIPDNVKTIGSNAFYGCGLRSVKIGSSVEDIGEEAFAKCTSLEGIKIPSSVNHIGARAFQDTVDYNKPDSKEIYIDTWLVYCLDTEKLALEVKNGTKGIADYAFNNMGFVTSATIPSGVKTIGSHAFYGCTKLSQLTIPDTIETIGDSAFSYTTIPNVTIPSSVTSLGYAAFNGCTNLKDITILNPTCKIDPSSLTIPQNAQMHVIDGSTAYDYANDSAHKRTFDYISNTKLGDVNGDNEVNLYDAIMIAKSLIKVVVLSEEQKKAADVNGNGSVDFYDAVEIAKSLLKK